MGPKQLRDDNGPRTHRLDACLNLNQQNAENRNLHLHAASVRTDGIYDLFIVFEKKKKMM